MSIVFPYSFNAVISEVGREVHKFSLNYEPEVRNEFYASALSYICVEVLKGFDEYEHEDDSQIENLGAELTDRISQRVNQIVDEQLRRYWESDRAKRDYPANPGYERGE